MDFHMQRRDKAVMDIIIVIVANGRRLGVFSILLTQRWNAESIGTTLLAKLTVSMSFKFRDKSNKNSEYI
jgi:DNA segregation ATPase FtsK/SpoIIIE-like protein